MLHAVHQSYKHLDALVKKTVAQSTGKPPIDAVKVGCVNVHAIVEKLSGFGFFKHLAIMVEIGLYRNSVVALFCMIFAPCSRRADVYARILKNAGYQADTTLPPGMKSEKPKDKQPRWLQNLFYQIDQKMSASQKTHPAPDVPPIGDPLSTETPPLAEPTHQKPANPKPAEPKPVDPEPPAVPILKSMPADESHAEKALPVGLTDEKPQLIEPEPETVRVELAPFVAKSAPVDTSPIAKPTHPKSAEPKSAEPEPVDPKSVEPKPVDPKPAEPKPIDPKSAEPEPIDPKSVEPKPVNPKPVEPEPIDPKSAEPEPSPNPESETVRVELASLVAESAPVGAGITALTFSNELLYDELKQCLAFDSIGAKTPIEIPCPNGVLDLSKFPDLTELEINDCPYVRSIKFSADNQQLTTITINRCENLNGDIDMSACPNLEYVTLAEIRCVKIIPPSCAGSLDLSVAGCTDPFVAVSEANSALKIGFSGCIFSDEALRKLQVLKTQCAVTGLPDIPETSAPVLPSLQVFVPKKPPTRAVKQPKPPPIERAIPVGIVNNGSSCYAASLMQHLYQNKPFREAIFTLRKIFPQADNPRTKLLHAIVALFTHLETGEGACPKRAMRDLLDAEFELGYLKARQQDDSNIMLTDILRNLRDLVRLIADREISAKITKLFPCQFPLRRTVKSSDGEKILYDSSSMSADDFFGVTPDGGTLEDAFRADYCRWQSRKYRDVDGALEMTRLECPMPDNFTVKIHRVHGDANGKNTLRCEFPESIDMSQFTSDSSSESLEYRLISIIAHCGTMDGGHYKAYVYRNGKWFECNDSIIREVSWSDIENAYGGRKDGFHATTLGYEKKPSNHYDRPPLL